MSINNHKNPPANLSLLLQDAKISIRESIDTQGGKLYELEPLQFCGRRAFVFEAKGKGVTVAIRAEIPQQSHLRHQPATSTDALMLLGALSFSLQTQNMETKLINGQEGLEAYIVSSHLCDEESDPATISRYLDKLQNLIQTIEPALLLSGQTQIDRIIQSVRPQFAAPIKEALRVEPIIVPTFDEAARDRMLQQMSSQ